MSCQNVVNVCICMPALVYKLAACYLLMKLEVKVLYLHCQFNINDM